ncbi:MalY/PatB family protein [Haloferula sp. A504]|uniref:MalY/PatB family protein n=1 Tax=Haloferula sp. A504 TaxID=3373601 RepID=UPI0031C6D7B8|nr:PatB family C-S lyase [Verrucomicrobiaceae bacterium E54]
MRYHFDTPIDRRGTGCIKFDRRPELDPYWVADMDFASCPEILEALHQRVNHGIFGYAQAHEGLEEAIDENLKQRHGATIGRDQRIHLGGLVPALSLAARAFCEPGEALMTCTPVYPPFLGVHRDAGARLITVDHTRVDGRYTFDWQAMADAVTDDTRVFLLCNPQNPLGRVFSAAEVEQVARFCADRGIVLVSDEIHCDLILDEATTPHFSALRLPAELRKHCITLLSPSKTWNIAGLGYAFAVVEDDSIRRRFAAARGHTLTEINALSYYAAEAAYRHGEPWRQELLAYLRTNREALDTFFAERLPDLKPVPAEATYLAWIDGRSLDSQNPANLLERQAGLFVSDGNFFGWPGWFRFNLACPRSRMLEGLEKIARAGRGS